MAKLLSTLLLLDFIKTVLPTAAASSEFGALAAAISTSCSLYYSTGHLAAVLLVRTC